MISSFVKAVVAGSMLAGLSALPALAQFKLEGEPKVAMIIFAQKNDGGWSQAFDEARQRMEKSMGVDDPLRRERARERDRHPAAGRALHRQGLQHHHRQRLRLLRHVQGARRAISERRVPQRRRHHQRPEPRVVLRPHLRDRSISAAWPLPPRRRPASSASSPPTRSAWSTGRSTPSSSAHSRSIRTPPPP